MKCGGLKITKTGTSDHCEGPRDCIACAGSGYYDDTDSKGRPIPCASCKGTGRE